MTPFNADAVTSARSEQAASSPVENHEASMSTNQKWL